MEDFQRRRQAVLRLGKITLEATGRRPGYQSPTTGLRFADILNGFGAICKVRAAGWTLTAACGASRALSQDQSSGTAAAAVDFGFMVLTSADPAGMQKRLAAEFAIGRIAMMLSIACVFRRVRPAPRTGSPLRAFDSELGVQGAVGLWDPAGFSADGYGENFQRRRQVELEHVRVNMLGSRGYIAPESIGELPGCLSPPVVLWYADIPYGHGVISKVPAAGWAQVVAYGASRELSRVRGLALPRPQPTSDSMSRPLLGLPRSRRGLLRRSRTAASR